MVFSIRLPLKCLRLFGAVFLFTATAYSQTPIPGHAGSIVQGAGSPLLANPISVYISGNYAYVASAGSAAIEILDISNPAAPVHKGSITDGTGGAKLSGPQSVFVSGNYAFVASAVSTALEILDVSNPAAPLHTSSINIGTNFNGPHSIFVSGNFAYVASYDNSTLEIVDVTSPATPLHKGSAAVGHPESVYVSGNYAYVANADGALEIVDVSNPTVPVKIGSIPNGAGGALLSDPHSVYVSGNYAYVASFTSDALEIVDVSNPAVPVHKGSLTDGTGGALLDGALSVYVSGNYAYLTSINNNALEIVDVSNPAAPVHKGNIVYVLGGALLGSAESVYVSGNYAYVGSYGNNALEIVDVTNPAAPTHKGSIVNGAGGALLFNPHAVFVSGSNAYVVGPGSDALEIVDVSNPVTSVHKGSIANGAGGALLSDPYSVYVSGNYAYIASQNSDALEIVDVSNPAAPVHKGSLVNGVGGALLDFVSSVFVSGTNAYLTSLGNNALEIVDVSNPAVPVHKGSISDGAGGASLSGPYSVYVSGNYAYVASSGSNALEIVDVTNPAAPVHKGSISTGGGALLNGAYSVFVAGGYAYVASFGSSALEIVDVTNPALPVHKGSIADGAGGALLTAAESVFVSGNYAYVASAGSNALEIVNVSNPAAPVHASKIVDASGGALLLSPESVYVSGTYAYVASKGSNALEIVALFTPPPPITAPASPVGQTSFTAKWNSVPNATGYFVDVSTDNFSTFVSGFNNSAQGGTSVSVTGLSPATTYQYRVRATNTNGTSGNSNVTSVLTIPAMPAATAATVISQTGFTANWNTVAGTSNYFIDVAADNGFASILTTYNNRLVATNSIAITGLSVGTPYYYRVRSSNSTGYSPSSITISTITIPPSPIASAATSIAQTSFQSNWSSAFGATGYFLDVSTSNTFASFVTGYNNRAVGNITINSTSGLNNSSTYYFRVRAANAGGTSGNSNTITVQTVPLALAQLTNGVATSPLQAASTSQALLGFSITSDGPQTMSSVTIALSGTPTGVITNFKLVKSVDNSFASAGDNTTITATATPSPTQVQFSGFTQSISGTINFFFVVDIDGTVTAASPSIQPSLSASSISLTVGAVSGTTITGTTYSFVTSVASDITTNAGTTTSISYQNFQTASGLSSANSVSLSTFQLRDGGATTDTDNLGTTLTAVTLQFGNPANLRRVAIFDGAANIAEQPAGSSVTFSGLNLTAADNGTKDFNVQATFQSSVTDNQYIQVSVTAATANNAGSGFAQANAGGAATSTTTNQLAVAATQIVYTVQPSSSQLQNTDVSPSPVAEARDALNNKDVDYANAATVTNSASLSMVNAPTAFLAGVLAFPNFQFTAPGTTTLFLASGSLTSAVSTAFSVIASQPTSQSTSLTFPSSLSTSITVNFTAGSGSSHLVVIKESSAVDQIPNDGMDYPANADFQLAGELVTGNGNRVVGSGSGTSFTVTGLTPNKQYNFQVFDFNGIGVTSNYITTPASGNPASQSTTGPTPIPDILLPTGGTVTDYRIISIPQGGSASSGLSEASYQKNWRVMHYQDEQTGNIDVRNITQLQVNNGYWVNSNINPAPAIRVAGTFQEHDATLTLHSGWNQIGNPFNFDVSWSDVLAQNTSVSGIGDLFTYNVPDVASNPYRAYDGLLKYGGGFVNNSNATSVSLTIPLSVNHFNGRIGSPDNNTLNSDLSSDQWFVPLILKVGNNTNDLGGFGMHPEANVSIDRFDAIALPHFFTFVDLSSNHPEFFQPSFMRDIVPTNAEYDWTFSASSNSRDQQSLLTWDNASLGNTTAQLLLYDVTSGVMVDMKKNSDYRFQLNGHHSIRFFYSRDGHVSPDITGIAQPYPNPFISLITIPFVTRGRDENIAIALYDIYGRQVRTLNYGRMEPGYYEAQWDGSDELGSRVAAGVYIYRFTSSDAPAKTGKIVME